MERMGRKLKKEVWFPKSDREQGEQKLGSVRVCMTHTASRLHGNQEKGNGEEKQILEVWQSRKWQPRESEGEATKWRWRKTQRVAVKKTQRKCSKKKEMITTLPAEDWPIQKKILTQVWTSWPCNRHFLLAGGRAVHISWGQGEFSTTKRGSGYDLLHGGGKKVKKRRLLHEVRITVRNNEIEISLAFLPLFVMHSWFCRLREVSDMLTRQVEPRHQECTAHQAMSLLTRAQVFLFSVDGLNSSSQVTARLQLKTQSSAVKTPRFWEMLASTLLRLQNKHRTVTKPFLLLLLLFRKVIHALGRKKIKKHRKVKNENLICFLLPTLRFLFQRQLLATVYFIPISILFIFKQIGSY